MCRYEVYYRVYTLMLPLPQGHLTLNPALLGECAMNCRAYAKALHYKELEFHKGPNTKIMESLIR